MMFFLLFTAKVLVDIKTAQNTQGTLGVHKRKNRKFNRFYRGAAEVGPDHEKGVPEG